MQSRERDSAHPRVASGRLLVVYLPFLCHGCPSRGRRPTFDEPRHGTGEGPHGPGGTGDGCAIDGPGAERDAHRGGGDRVVAGSAGRSGCTRSDPAGTDITRSDDRPRFSPSTAGSTVRTTSPVSRMPGLASVALPLPCRTDDSATPCADRCAVAGSKRTRSRASVPGSCCGAGTVSSSAGHPRHWLAIASWSCAGDRSETWVSGREASSSGRRTGTSGQPERDASSRMCESSTVEGPMPWGRGKRSLSSYSVGAR